MKLYQSIYILFIFAVLSCDISDNEFEPNNTFVKIYDDNRFEYEYYPLDIIQTSDDGFLILSEVKFDQSLFTSAYVLKTNSKGEVTSSTLMNAPFSRPVDGWLSDNDSYYFVCMDANTLVSYLVNVGLDGSINTTDQVGSLTYPLVASATDADEFALLSFDNSSNETVLATFSMTGQIKQKVSYSIGVGVDVEKPIIDHLTRNRDQLPFIVGKTADGLYYFNGFYNFTFSLVFSDFGVEPTGVSQGQLSQGGISALSGLGGDLFGVARFNFGANFINPLSGIPTNSITSSTDIDGNIFAEIENGARTKIMHILPDNKLIYGTHTQSNQIVLYGFDKEDGRILGTSYMGDGNPYYFSSFTLTSDGGISILAQTAIEGRFQRIAVFKRDEDFFNSLILRAIE